MLKVWGRATSVNVQKVMWLVAELGLEHERIDIGGKHGGNDDPAFRAISPDGRIPAVVDGETTVFESNACLRYIASRFEAEALWPAEIRARAQVDAWMEWSQNQWYMAIQGLFWHYVRTPRDQRDPRQEQAANATMAKQMAIADRWLGERPYIAGDSLSLADFVIGTTMYRTHTLEWERPEAPNVRAYYQRLQDRPAFVAHVMIDYDELRAPGAERPA